MESGTNSVRLKIDGMTCVNCQHKIDNVLRQMPGIKSVRAHYNTGIADISYNESAVSLQDISAAIEKLGYRVSSGNKRQAASFARVIVASLIIVALYMLLQRFGVLNFLVPGQLADTQMGYGMLFVIGLVTSIHCIAMCGGINLSQSIPRGSMPDEAKTRFSAFKPSFLYNFGRVLSYTVVGGILGLIGLLFGGGVDAGLPIMAQGILKILAGTFMAIMGINMLGLFPWLRKLQPRMPKIFARKMGAEKARSKGPLIVGLLNGFMPCGPLQSMQIVALASGNPFSGALSMFLFSMGTVPLMLGFGSIVSALGKKHAKRVMDVGAVLVVVLGLAMLSQGGSLSGLLLPSTLLTMIFGLFLVGIASSIPVKRPAVKIVSTLTAVALALVMLAVVSTRAVPQSVPAEDISDIQIINGQQVINSTLSPSSYPDITVHSGVPVKWIINAPDGSINGCNNSINILEYNILNYAFQPGDNIIEFTPAETGRFQYSCWMGMIHGSITVTSA